MKKFIRPVLIGATSMALFLAVHGADGPRTAFAQTMGSGQGNQADSAGPGQRMPGSGMGQGMGQGMGPGMGQGMGQGMGSGMGPGMGQGMGQGMGPGMMQGQAMPGPMMQGYDDWCGHGMPGYGPMGSGMGQGMMPFQFIYIQVNYARSRSVFLIKHQR